MACSDPFSVVWSPPSGSDLIDRNPTIDATFPDDVFVQSFLLVRDPNVTAGVYEVYFGTSSAIVTGSTGPNSGDVIQAKMGPRTLPGSNPPRDLLNVDVLYKFRLVVERQCDLNVYIVENFFTIRESMRPIADACPRGIRFKNVKRNDPRFLNAAAGQIVGVHAPVPVIQTSSDKSNLSGVIRGPGRRLPAAIEPIEPRSTDRFGNPVFPFTGE